MMHMDPSVAMLLVLPKTIAIKAYLDIEHNIVVTHSTKVEDLEKLIRSEFMLCNDTEFKLLDHEGRRVALDRVLCPPLDERHIDKYYLFCDRTPPRYLSCDQHNVLLREPTKNASMLFNPMMAAEKETAMCASAYVNLPMQVQMRRMMDMDRMYYLIEMRVDARFGLTTPMHDPKAMWMCNSFKLKMRRSDNSMMTPTLHPYMHSPTAEPDMAMIYGDHSMMGEAMQKPMSMMSPFKENSKRSGLVSGAMRCVYNPRACRTIEDSIIPVDLSMEMDKMMKEREHAWTKSKPSMKRVEGGYMEWVMDMDKNSNKEPVLAMEKMFVQTFMLECQGQIKEPLRYEFDIIGEMMIQNTSDAASNDEVFEVMQGQPLGLNPGRKRISVVQHNKVCVDLYPGNMSLCCYKKGESEPVMNFGLHGADFMALYAKVNRESPNGHPNGRKMNPKMDGESHIKMEMDDEPMMKRDSNRESLGTDEMLETENQEGELGNAQEMPEKEMMTSSDTNKGKSPVAKMMQKLRFSADSVPVEQKAQQPMKTNTTTTNNKKKNNKKKKSTVVTGEPASQVSTAAGGSGSA